MNRNIKIINRKTKEIKYFRSIKKMSEDLNTSRNSIYSFIKNKKNSKLNLIYDLISIDEGYITTKLTQEEYLNNIKKRNPSFFKYYKVVSEYKGEKEYIEIECKTCGCKNIVRNDTLYIKKGFCPVCDQIVNYTAESFEMKFYKFYDKNEYVLLSKYVNSNTPLKIFHKKCNRIYYKSVEQTFKNHGCKFCNFENKYINSRIFKNKEEIEKEFYRLNLDKEYFVKNFPDKMGVKVEVICKSCNIKFYPYFSKFLKECGTRCACKNNYKGEYKIKKHLEDNHIAFIPQHSFNDCRNKKPLPFDFYLPNYNILIEYDGEAHYYPINFNGNLDDAEIKLKKTQNNDNIKNEYCKNKNIELIRIPYWEFDKINDNLDKVLKRLGARRV